MLITFQKIEHWNRYRREVCSREERSRCDHAGCSVTFKALRRESVHIKKTHDERIVRSIPPANQSGSGLEEEDLPELMFSPQR
jgi:hypothetical protein